MGRGLHRNWCHGDAGVTPWAPPCGRHVRRGVGASIRPSPIASVAISTRLLAPSLPLIIATWNEAVFLLMKSSSAISPSERPAATSARTSRSRACQFVSVAG